MKTSLVCSNKDLLDFVLAILLFGVLFLTSLTQGTMANAQSGAVRPRATTPTSDKPPTNGQSTVKGRVVYKDNSHPMKGLRLRIFTPEDAPGSRRLAFTNDQGEFRLENLAAGKYYVTLQGPGVAAQSGMGMRLPLPMAAIPKREDFEEIIPRHDAVFTVDGTNTVEVEVRIARGGSISGKVLAANGAPEENVAVSFISREANGSGRYTARFSAQTNRDGAYRIENIPEGDYIVAAATEDKSASLGIRARMRGESQVVTYHPAATSIRDAMIVRVDPGRETGGVNVTLVTRNSFAISGTVVRQSDGTAIPGANVVLRNKESELAGALVPGMGQRSTRTDADGRWSFSSVMEGAYVVAALAPNSRPDSRPARLSGGPADLRSVDPTDREQAFRESRQRFLVAEEDVAVAGADISGVLITISGPGSVGGSVEADNGALPSNLVIFLELISKGQRPGPPLPVRVRPDGSFSFSGIQGGEIFLSAGLPPDSNYFIKSLTANGDDVRRVSLRVIEGAEAGPVRIVISTGVGVLTGRVHPDKAPEGRGNLVVLLAPVESEKQRFRTAYLTTRTAPDGRYSVSGAPGEYFVFARRREELPAIITEEFVKSQAAHSRRVVIVSGQPNQMDLSVQ